VTVKLVWIGPQALLEGAATALTEVLFPPAQAVSLAKLDETARDAESDWRLEAYFEDPPQQRLAPLLAPFGLGRGTEEDVPQIDWVKHSLSGLGIVRAGRFVLYGTHDAANLPREKDIVPIRVDANEAFGTGHHPTTAGCLTLLDRLAGVRPLQILDLGTGSGVLAIAAAKLWDRSVLAVDVDPKSAAIAQENAALNGVGDLVQVIGASGFDAPETAARAPFDFVFANILAGPLVDLAADMTRHIGRNGRAMLAGFMAEQEGEVAAAYAYAGFRSLNRLDHDTWPVLLLARR
jgi:ribosomal protein L11 methyltransferase